VPLPPLVTIEGLRMDGEIFVSTEISVVAGGVLAALVAFEAFWCFVRG
jgi:hypothetical protein